MRSDQLTSETSNLRDEPGQGRRSTDSLDENAEQDLEFSSTPMPAAYGVLISSVLGSLIILAVALMIW